MMKLRPILGLAALVALAPLAWAGSPAVAGAQAKQPSRSTAASRQSSARSASAPAKSSQQNALAVASGTNVSAQLLTTLNAKKLKPGQRVVARVTQNVKQNGRVVIRKGSRLVGHVTSVQASGKGSAGSAVGVAFDQLVQGRSTSSINAIVTSIVSVPAMPAMQPMGMSQPPMMGQPMGGGAPPMGGSPARSGGGGGGLIGGTVGAAGGVASSVGSTVGAGGAAAGSTVGSTVGAAGGAAGNVGGMGRGMGQMAANPIIVSSNTGAAGHGSAGLSNPLATAQLGASGAASNQTLATSTFHQPKGNLNLQSGSQLQFQVVGSAHAHRPAVH